MTSPSDGVPAENGVAQSERSAGYSRVRSPELVTERQAQLVAAALPLFWERGFHQTSVRMIADAAGISMGNLYQYIRKKEDLLYLACLSSMADYRAILAHADDAASVRERIELMTGQLIEMIHRRRRHMKLLYRESASLGDDVLPDIQNLELEVTDRFAALIQEGIDAGAIGPCHPQVLAFNILMLGQTWAVKGWALKRHLDFPAYRDEQVNVALRMIPFIDQGRPDTRAVDATTDGRQPSAILAEG